jgi:hypothetical protein
MTKPIEIDNLLDVVAAVVSRGTVEARPAAAG